MHQRLNRSAEHSSAIHIQPALEIGGENDEYEREANAVADKVMRMKEDEEEKIRPMHDEEEGKVMCMTDEDERIQPMTEKRGINIAPSEVEQGIASTRGNGNALPAGLQREMGGKIGADFSGVRIHTDKQAEMMNKEIGAKAFTHGNDIYFNSGQYNPASQQGKHLLAHELTHMVQQNAPDVQCMDDYFGRVYIMKQDETLEQVATKFKTTMGELIDLNPQYKDNVTSVKAGDEIKLPQVEGKKKEHTWDYAKREREYESDAQVPKAFNYEFINHRLIAHTFSGSDIKSIADFLVAFYAPHPEEKYDPGTEEKLKAYRAKASDGDRVDIDVTPFLPAYMQTYLASLENFFKNYREQIKTFGTDPTEIRAKQCEILGLSPEVSDDEYFEAYRNAGKDKQMQVDKLSEKISQFYSQVRDNPRSPRSFSINCHDFTSFITNNKTDINSTDQADQGVPLFNSSYETDIKSAIDGTAEDPKYTQIGTGENPADVKIGDIAVFLSGVELYAKGEGPKPFHQLKTGDLIHSAVIMKVTEPALDKMEIFEKKDPFKDTGTRTVSEVLVHYENVAASVVFMRAKK